MTKDVSCKYTTVYDIWIEIRPRLAPVSTPELHDAANEPHCGLVDCALQYLPVNAGGR